jgi:YebC/PmpR family DNA-binding regulatory protein
MGRMFEKRKHKIFARNAKMSKMFTKFGRVIAIAVKESGPDPDNNARLRAIISNAKSINMPKANIEAAITRASTKGGDDYEEISYEGFGNGGVSIFIEAASDNPTRTVANVRSYFNKCNGSLSTNGSHDYTFERKAYFKVDAEAVDPEEFEFEMIDHGLEELTLSDGFLHIYCPYNQFGAMQSALESKGVEPLEALLTREVNTFKSIDKEQLEDNLKLLDKLEEDDDVTNVYHNISEESLEE